MDSVTDATAAELLNFWFGDDVRPLWFASTPEFDAALRARYEPLWRAAAQGGCAGWENTPEGALALVIVLDQFPLNMFRGTSAAYGTEAAARDVAAGAIERGHDGRLPAERRAFLYLPFMHSERMADQERSVALYAAAGLDAGLRYTLHHLDIIRRFGRFPHRNAVLGRESTAEEIEWLASPESFKG